MRSWRFKVKFKPMNGGNDNKANTDRKAVIQAMTYTQCYKSGGANPKIDYLPCSRMMGGKLFTALILAPLVYNVPTLGISCLNENSNELQTNK